MADRAACARVRESANRAGASGNWLESRSLIVVGYPSRSRSEIRYGSMEAAL